MVKREPEWDDASRDEQLDLVDHDAEVHATCGQHDSIAGTRDLRLEPATCPDCAGIELSMRVQSERDEAEDKRKYGTEKLPPESPRAGDGRRWLMRVLSAEDKAAEAASKDPSRPPRERRERTR